MYPVRAKKHLGQHFLNDENIARKITENLKLPCDAVLEVGPGTGVLTKYLLEMLDSSTSVKEENSVKEKLESSPSVNVGNSVKQVLETSAALEDNKNGSIKQFLTLDVDRDSIAYLKETYPDHAAIFREADFLRFNPEEFFKGCFSVIGNFPYNISSQIFFKVLDHVDQIPEVVCMLQKEVAERIAAPPGSKTYGILSVLLQAWYNIEYLFTVEPHLFIPPPKVRSAVIRLTRNTTTELGCDPIMFKTVVKTAFNQRRKTLRNALKSLNITLSEEMNEMLDKRAERLSVADFVYITNSLAIRPTDQKG